MPVGAVPTDNGRELCGKPDTHPYELLTAMEGIEHRRTKVRSLRTNGFVERMNPTLLDECSRVEGHRTWYESTDQIQAGLDRFLEYHNLRRTHQGSCLKGRKRIGALCESLQLPVEHVPPLATFLQTSEGDDRKEAA